MHGDNVWAEWKGIYYNNCIAFTGWMMIWFVSLFDHTLFSKGRLESDSAGKEENFTFCSLYKWIWTLANSYVSFSFHLSKYKYQLYLR